MLRTLICLLVVLGMGASAFSATLYVDIRNSLGPWDGSAGHPFNSVQSAINAATSGSTIIIKQGTYKENLDITLKDLVLTATDPVNPVSPQVTIIDADRNGTAATIANCTVSLKGLTFKRGKAGSGAGINCRAVNLEISNCIISDNYTSSPTSAGANAGVGAGLYILGQSNVTVTKSSILRNYTGKGANNFGTGSSGGSGGRGGEGGAIYCKETNLTIVDCNISGNYTGAGGASGADGTGGRGGLGGAIYYFANSPNYAAVIQRCSFANNYTGNGGAAGDDPGDGGKNAGNGGDGGVIYAKSSRIAIRGCTFLGNSSGEGGHVSLYASAGGNGGNGGFGGAIYATATSPMVEVNDCNFISNFSGPGGNGQGSVGGTGGNGGSGGAIYCSFAAVSKCRLEGNVTGSGGSSGGSILAAGGSGGPGGAIYCSDSNLVDCGFKRNFTGQGGDGASQMGGNGGPGGDGGTICAIESNISNCEIRDSATGWAGNTVSSQGGNGGRGGNGGGVWANICKLDTCTVLNSQAGQGGSSAGAIGTAGGAGGNGGGIYCSGSELTRCLAARNEAGNGGSAVPSINTINGGDGGRGAGIYAINSTILNCTYSDNKAGFAGVGTLTGIAGASGFAGGAYCDSVTVLTNSILWGNVPDQLFHSNCGKVSHCDIEFSNCSASTGNRIVNPLFANTDANDYHLKSRAGRYDPVTGTWVLDEITSPCIDAGSPYSIYANEPMPNGFRINLGAYGNGPEASKTPVIRFAADINSDGSVDMLDLSLMAQRWMELQYGIPEDIIRNGAVDLQDYSAWAAESGKYDCWGVVGYWKLDENQGLVAIDSSGNSNTGTLINHAIWTGGRFNTGLHFDGIDDALQVGTGSLKPYCGSVAMWVYPQTMTNTTQYLFGHSTQGTWGSRIQLYTDDIEGNLDLGMGNTHALRTNIVKLKLRQWHHLVLTWDGTTYCVYVDGAMKATGSYSDVNEIGPVADFGNDGFMASRTQAFNGSMDDLRIYNWPITQKEVTDLYNLTLP